MKNCKILALILVLVVLTSCIVACDPTAPQLTDYVSQLTLDMDSDTLKQEATVRNYIDGDTTHFNVPKSVSSTGVLKARYLAINTPESTGMIEEYGKAASNFTKEKLKSAVSIIVESDNSKWNIDSTGDRFLVWVWYQPSEGAEYRNLNLEILQEGLAVGSNTQANRYGDICMSALTQAQNAKLKVFSGEPDPDMYYGSAIEMTLKELRLNIDEYNNKKVAFEGVISMDDGGSVWIEEFDQETGVYFGITVYYGNSGLTSTGLDILQMGNRVRIVGTVQYWEAGGTYQISGLKYNLREPDDPDNIQKISDGHSAAYPLVSADQFAHGTVYIEQAESNDATLAYAEAVVDTSIAMNGLTVKSVYTTQEGDSAGAMTLTCQAEDGTTISVRTAVFKNADGTLMTEADYLGKTINVKGFVSYYNETYQINVLAPKYVTIVS